MGTSIKNKAESLGAELYFLPGTAEVLEQRHFVFPAKIRELDMLDPAKNQNYMARIKLIRKIKGTSNL